MSYGWEAPPLFFENVSQPLSAIELNVLRTNAGVVDMLSYRRMNAFDSSGDIQTDSTPGNYTTKIPAYATNIRIWKGYLHILSGMTTLTLLGSAGNVGSTSIKVYVNGAEAATISPTSTWAQDIDINPFSAGDVIQIELRVLGTRPANAFYVVHDIYGGPLSFGTSWPGVPTFATTFSASLLTQLAAAEQWCYDRMLMVPNVARRIQRFINGPFKDPTLDATHAAYTLWYGSVLRGYTKDIIRIYGQVINQSSPSLQLRCFINGALQSPLGGPWGIGTTNFSLSYPFPAGVSVGDRARISLLGQVVDAGAATLQSKWTFSTIRSEGDSNPANTHPYATLPAAFVDGSVSAATVRDRLNQVATIVANTKSRLDAAPHIWNRARAMRTWYSVDDNTRGVFDVRSRPQMVRHGAQLVVRGRGVKVLFGAIAIPTNDPTKGDQKGYDGHTFSQSQSIIDSDKAQTTTIELDSITGLFRQTAYELDGEVEIAYEIH